MDNNKPPEKILNATAVRWLGIASAGFLLCSSAILSCCFLFLIVLTRSGTFNRFIYEPVDIDFYWATIPAGEFEMGGHFRDEKPKHTVYLDVFEIGRYEITNRQYAQCVRTRICNAPNNKIYNEPEFALHPVTDVTWYDARTFCEWVGGRLPTEAEWEKAARGGLEGKSYPWGDEPPVCLAGSPYGANFLNLGEGCANETLPVGSFSPNGYDLYDTMGNVSEWVNDWYSETYYREALSVTINPQGPWSGNGRVLRGGSWVEVNSNVSVALRRGFDPSGAFYGLGFRCARSVP